MRLSRRLKQHFDRSAFTLVELLVVMAVAGAIAVAASCMLGGRNVTTALAAREEAQHFVTAVRMARTNAISTGQPMVIRSVVERKGIVGFQVNGRGYELVNPVHRFSDSLDVAWSAQEVTLLPSGMAIPSLNVTFKSSRSKWQVVVVGATGQAIVSRSK